MRKVRRLWRRVRATLTARHVDRDFDAELTSHIEMHEEDGVRSGLNREEARRRALVLLGGAEQLREIRREAARLPWIDALQQDLHYGIRQLCRARGFTFAAILTMALGIGANTAVFSAVEAVLLRKLPYRNPDRLVVVWQTDAAHRATGAYFNNFREFQEWKQHSRSFERLAALTWATPGFSLLWRGEPIDLLAIPVTTDFFPMLGASARLGRTFSQADLNAPCTLVLAYPFWKNKLGAPPDIVSRNLTVGRTSCTVAGVMPESFSFYPVSTDAWMLITPSSEYARNPWHSMTGVFGLLKPGVSRAAAGAELAAIQANLLSQAPSDLGAMRNLSPDMLDLQSNFIWLSGRNLRIALWLLLGAAGIILLVACLNVANLLLGRTVERSQEMAVRAALGAARGRLFRQVLTESCVLATMGTAAGWALAVELLRWFRAANPVELPPGATVALDSRVLAFSIAIGFAAAFVFGVVPAWHASHLDPNTTLKSRNPSSSVRTHRMAKVLVIAQVSLSMVLVTGAVLVSESLMKFTRVPLGYRTDRVLTAQIHLPPDRYQQADVRTRTAEMLKKKIAALPGVEAVALASDFTPRGEDAFSVGGSQSLTDLTPSVASQDIGDGFFSVMQIPLLQGRFFDGRDTARSQPVAIVNQALVRKYFHDGGAVGRIVKLGRPEDPTEPWLTVVGVVADVKTTTVFQEMGYVEAPAVYRPIAQSAPQTLALMVTVRETSTALAGEIQQKLSSIDGNLLLSSVETMDAMRTLELAQPRFRAALFSAFAIIALILALVGLNGVLSRLVVRGTREIGIRMALGADRRVVLRAVLRQACILAGAGVVLGALLTAISMRFLEGLLYGLPSHGVRESALIGVAMILAALAATWGPARRAASVDPVIALRGE